MRRLSDASLRMDLPSIVAVSAISIVCPHAFAQTTPAQAIVADQSSAAERLFSADYFEAFNPVTAEDMVRQVPGFSLEDGEDRRGFAGAIGNVLIDGRAPSSKTPVSQQLARIAAKDVASIVLHSGAGSSDMRGENLYVDVRLRRRESGATNTYMIQASLLDPSNNINPLISGTSAFRLGDADVSVSLQAQPSRRGRVEYDKRILEADGGLVSRSDEYLQGSYWEYKLSGRASWARGERDTFALNGEIIPSRDGRHTYSETYDPTGGFLRVDDSKVVGDNAWSAQLGGDWTHQVSDELSFKALALARQSDKGSSERYSYVTAATTGRDTYIDRAALSGEYIARTSATWSGLPRHAIDISLEGAFNFLDSGLDIGVSVNGGPRFDATPKVANTRVEESRSEIALVDVWSMMPTFRLESGVAIEASRIVQSGDADQVREFSYVKPRFSAVWSPGDVEYRFLLERDVAQLDFSEFASAVSLFDGIQTVGNPNLEPEKTWRAQLDWERRFGPKGALVVSLFHDAVEDVQDQIPIAGQDGAGNLGDGTRTGIRIDATAPLDSWGLSGGELRFRGMAQDTRVDDPVTGETRAFSEEEDWSFSLDYRQAIPVWKLLVGASVEHSGDRELYRLAEYRISNWLEPHIGFYVETTAVKGLTIRLSASNISLPQERRSRYFFSPDRSSATNLSSAEIRDATGAYGTRSVAVRVTGRF